MKKLLKTLIATYLFVISQQSMANDCFLNAAESGQLSAQELGCIQQIVAGNKLLNSQVSSTASAVASLEQLHADNPNDKEFQALSEAASKVYYKDKFCGPDSKETITCGRLRRLSLLHPSGVFSKNYDCSQRAPSHPQCAQYVETISQWLGGNITRGGTECDSGLVNKFYCNDVVTAFLSNKKCDGSANQDDCKAELLSRFNADGEHCRYDNYRDSFAKTSQSMSRCSQGADVSQASVPSGGNNDSTGSDSTANNNPTPDTAGGGDANDKLQNLTDKVAKEVFGGNGSFNGGDFQTASINSNTNIPDVQIENPQGGDISLVNDSVNGANYDPGQSSSLSALARSAIPTYGGPTGGAPTQASGNNSGSSGRGGYYGGYGSGLSNNRNGSNNNRPSSRSGGYRGSPLQSVAESMSGGYIGADGGALPGSGTSNKPTSAVDKKIQERLAQAKKNDINKAALQGALNKHLQGGPLAPNLVIQSSYFPAHSEVYMQLNQQGDLLDESGK